MKKAAIKGALVVLLGTSSMAGMTNVYLGAGSAKLNQGKYKLSGNMGIELLEYNDKDQKGIVYGAGVDASVYGVENNETGKMIAFTARVGYDFAGSTMAPVKATIGGGYQFSRVNGEGVQNPIYDAQINYTLKDNTILGVKAQYSPDSDKEKKLTNVFLFVGKHF